MLILENQSKIIISIIYYLNYSGFKKQQVYKFQLALYFTMYEMNNEQINLVARI